MKRFVSILILATLIASGCYDRHSEPLGGVEVERDNCDISELRALCQDGCYLVSSDMICECRVTSSDKGGNFYRTMVVEDESGALEIKLGTYNSAEQYPIGLMVSLRLNGLALMIENGVVQMGLPPQSSDTSPREMETQAVINHYIVRSDNIEPIQPMSCEIAALDQSLCGRFISIENLLYSPLKEEEPLLEEYRRFADEQGNTIFAYVSPYADFAKREIPMTEVAIRGILYYETIGKEEEKHFVIRPNFADDFTTNSNID